MKNIFTPLYLALILLLATNSVYSQSTPPDTTRPLPVNAGFDVIIKKNGDIIYGLVKEVGQTLIKYQRTDIPDGPIYTLQRDEVYAISYRNQVKDILSPAGTIFTPAKDTVQVRVDTAMIPPPVPKAPPALINHFSFQDGNVRLGLGFIRSYTKVTDANQYSSSNTFPIVSIGYDVRYTGQVRLGVQLAFGSHKFSKQEYDSYDSTQSNITLKENIFTLHLYGKYSFATSLSTLQPYILAGIGINSSYINSEYAINFINNTDKVLLVKSGSRSIGLGIIARIGTEYFINNKLRIFGDVGVGPSVLNIGISVNVD